MPDFKILHIDAGKILGGGQIQLLNIVKGLQNRMFKNTVVTPKNSPLSKMINDVPIIELNFKGEYDFFSILKLKKIIKDEFDIIITHDAHSNFYGAVLKNKNNKFVIRRTVTFPLRNFISKWKFNRADLIVAISNSVKNVLINSAVEEKKIKVIYPQIDLNRFFKRDVTIERFNLNPDYKYVGNIAALEKNKNQEVLIHAFKIIKNINPKIKLVIAGEGSNEDYLKKLVNKLNLNDTVFFLGYREDIPELLSCLKIFLFPSLYGEGLGGVLLEAMSCEVPIIAYHLDCVKEIIKDNLTGFLIYENSPQLYAEKILNILENEDLTTKITKQAKEYVKNFSIDEISKQYENAILNLW